MKLSRPAIIAAVLSGIVLISVGGVLIVSGKTSIRSTPEHGAVTLTALPNAVLSQTSTNSTAAPQTGPASPSVAPTNMTEPVPTGEPTLPVTQAASNLTAVDSCADLWGFTSQPLGIPDSLIFPTTSQELYTENDYYYLAAMLIQKKAVDTTGCLYNGLQTFTTASMCGVNAARPLLVEWQNKFDPFIFDSGIKTGIPPVLIKKLFALESQFWPGYYQTISSSGFGQLNQNGADTLIIYNPDYYKQLCPQVLHPDACQKKYDELSADEKQLLRGKLVSQVNASCETCPDSIDLTVAIDSIQVFTDLLKANCQQVNNILYNITYVRPASLISYVDLWRLTLANYNSGPGCTATAIQEAWTTYRDLDWAHVSQFFIARECSTALFYVNEIFP